MKPDISLWQDDLDSSFKVFHELMAHRVQEILLVFSPYDAFIMEEDTSLSTRIINEYRGLNLSKPPRLTSVAVAEEALELIRYKKFDLVITLPQVGEMDCNTLGLRIKEICPQLPVILLAHNMKAISPYLERGKRTGIDNIYIWSANPALLLALVKNIEDHHNVEWDTSLAMVRVIILVEDSPIFKSYFLPLLYKEVMAQTQAVMNESLNEEHRLLKMRARPKILVAGNYEEAMQLYHKYKKFVFGVISDTRFPRKKVLDDTAGVEFLSHIRKAVPDMPLLLVSSASANAQKAEVIPASFIHKNSAILAEEVHQFFLVHLGFGDFVFNLPDGSQIDRASNLHIFEKKLAEIPDECLLYHAQNNHFSNWVMARSEIGLASQLHKSRLKKFKSVNALRQGLIKQVHTLRRVREQGIVTSFAGHDFDADVMQFVRIGNGSMGGKALGLAFMAAQLKKQSWLHEKYPQFEIVVSPTLVITTRGFHAFMQDNNLTGGFEQLSDTEIADVFLKATMPAWLEKELGAFLHQVKVPVGVRSSSLLEDALYRPLAGLFETYMLPNNGDHATRLQQLITAVKLIFASTFYTGPRTFYSETERYATGSDSMAVVIQILAGRLYGDYFYPAISGMAKSYNYYPVGHMTAKDGIAQIALGFGKTVVEGEKCLLFSPAYPENLPQFTNVDDMLASGQQTFYALPMKNNPPDLDYRHSNLVKRQVDEAEHEPAVQALVSTYTPAEHAVRDNFGKGPKIVTFASILKHRLLPLAELLQDLLELGHKGMSCDVEIEFAVDLGLKNQRSKFHFLQIRPMAIGEDQYEVTITKEEIDKACCYSSKPLGHGVNDTIADIVYVKPETFHANNTKSIAHEISRLNARLKKEGRPYLLIGPGRWGSADPWLGIPVRWEDISGVATIIELRNDQLSAEDSQGTHFFHNITAMGIKYFTITENDGKLPDFINWQWLATLAAVEETKYVRHVRLKNNLLIKVDSQTSQGVVLAND